IGERADAEKQYLLAAQGGMDSAAQRSLAAFYLVNGDVAKVEAILRPLTISSETTLRRWARRTLALAWASSGVYAQSTEAIALLDRNVAENANDPEDLRIRSL